MLPFFSFFFSLLFGIHIHTFFMFFFFLIYFIVWPLVSTLPFRNILTCMRRRALQFIVYGDQVIALYTNITLYYLHFLMCLLEQILTHISLLLLLLSSCVCVFVFTSTVFHFNLNVCISNFRDDSDRRSHSYREQKRAHTVRCVKLRKTV